MTASSSPVPAVPVAITGMAVLLPGAPDLATYWTNLRDGVDAVTEIPPGRLDASYHRPPHREAGADRLYCRRGGFVDGLAEVDAAGLGIMPAAVPDTEPDQLISLTTAARALADAGGEDRLPPRERIGVVLGRGGYLTPGLVRLDQRVRTAHQLTRTLGELLPGLGAEQLARVREAFTATLGPERPEAAIGLVPNLAASRIANRLDLRGPAYTVDAACASSLVAVDHAVAQLARGGCDLMLAGGVHHCHDITLWSVFTQLRALSPTDRIRPFHSGADGLLIGEGTGVVVLKRFADAVRDGDRVYAVIRGTGVASDGRSSGLMHPDSGGQARAVRQAWHAAGLDPRAPGSLGLLEAHGTATPAGDTAELATLAEVFGPPARAGEARAALGSVKSMIGHCMPAAGIASLVKAALATYHATLLPTLHCDTPHPALERTRFHPLASSAPWDAPLRRAAVNAFGFGGINAHVVLEEAPSPRPVRRPASPAAAPAAVREPERVLRLSAATPAALARLLDTDDSTLLAAARELRDPEETAAPGPVRLAIVAPDARRLALARRIVPQGRPWRGRSDLWFTPSPLLGRAGGGRLAFLFPGLDAETASGTDEVAAHYGLRPPGRADSGTGDVARHGLAVLRTGRVLDTALRAEGVHPDGLAGHSVGEWAAMISGGIFAADAADAVLAAFDPDTFRVPGVVFAALGASAERARQAIAPYPGLVLSHDNSPGQSMVCGPEEAVRALLAELRGAGVICQVLPFRSGFHTPMLEPYLTPLAEGVQATAVHPARVPVWSGTTAEPFPAGPAEVRALFLRHLLEPVRFRQLTQSLYGAGFRAFVQVGAGGLTSLVGDTLRDRDHLSVAADSPRHGGLAQLLRVRAALWAEGYEERRRATTRQASVRLDLGGALLALDPDRRDALRAELATATATAPPPVTAAPLARFHRSHPLAAEVDALLGDTASAVAAVLHAAPGAIAAPGKSPTATAAPAMSATTAPLPEPAAGAFLRVSVETMPYLLDHCFFPQRPGWPEPADRHPVVPATTVLHHLTAAARRAAPGRQAVAVRDLRLEKWVTALPPVDVALTARPRPDGRYDTAFGPYARAVVETAPAYPPPPPRWAPAGAAEEPCALPAHRLYADRWMFHGPAFQGITELTALGPDRVRGTITVPPAPGALLDNVGQLLGYWLMATRRTRTVLFPVALRELRLYGPDPVPGTRVHCRIAVTAVTEDTVVCDAQLTLDDGTVWAEIAGWRDRRFAAPDTRRDHGYPERRALSEETGEGWTLLRDTWPDLASRDLVMRTHLGQDERAAYERRSPRAKGPWLLGRIAAKDAVRHWLWRQGAGDVYPAELRVRNDEQGRPRAEGVHGRELPPLRLSLAHRGRAAVALVRSAESAAAVGIDIEEVADRSLATVRAALGAGELALLAGCAGTGGPSLWFTRFWAAKEAAAKAEGTGLGGRPRDFEVTEAAAEALTVTVGGRRHLVRCTLITDSDRAHVVAWTVTPPEENPL
ncbi:beta-ketoacyl synthase N-terminal-like domain-containing protein [Streptomyces sp. NPDC047097]|uniref:beta-ketoacyl synthase N-terminal-like domain-containing protein n=1 Tax=Streptomyces sp. NPDC047097 TaxID=3155260 RepID=UPI0033D2FCA9